MRTRKRQIKMEKGRGFRKEKIIYLVVEGKRSSVDKKGRKPAGGEGKEKETVDQHLSLTPPRPSASWRANSAARASRCSSGESGSVEEESECCDDDEVNETCGCC